MVSLSFIAPFTIITPNCNSARCSKLPIRSGIRSRVSSRGSLQCASTGRSDSRSYSSPSHEEEEEEDEPQEGQVQEFRVPEHWLDPSKALEESEWLRVNLHKWLDDEYCPEATNVDISIVAARSYYKSLVEKQTDLGEILLKMAKELQSISYQDSFHGAFSSANAAIDLIIQRLAKD